MFMVFHDQNEFHPSRLDLRVARAEEISISGQPGPWIPMQNAPARNCERLGALGCHLPNALPPCHSEPTTARVFGTRSVAECFGDGRGFPQAIRTRPQSSGDKSLPPGASSNCFIVAAKAQLRIARCATPVVLAHVEPVFGCLISFPTAPA